MTVDSTKAFGTRVGFAKWFRFPSRLDGNACLVIFEGLGRLELTADPVPLTDPAPQAVARLPLEPAAASVDHN
jgi:hypothetical protein